MDDPSSTSTSSSSKHKSSHRDKDRKRSRSRERSSSTKDSSKKSGGGDKKHHHHSSHRDRSPESERKHQDKKRKKAEEGGLTVLDDEDDAGVWVEKGTDEVEVSPSSLLPSLSPFFLDLPPSLISSSHFTISLPSFPPFFVPSRRPSIRSHLLNRSPSPRMLPNPRRLLSLSRRSQPQQDGKNG